MANLTITAAGVLAGTGQKKWGTAGTTLTAGMAVYLDSATNTYKPADSSSVAKSAVEGLALNNALSGQPVEIQQTGSLTLPASGAQSGWPVMLSLTAGTGALALFDDTQYAGGLISGSYPCFIGFFNAAATVLTLAIGTAGAQATS